MPKSMQAIDIILAIPMAVLIFLGWRRGVVREAATLVGILVGIWAAIHLSQQVAKWLHLEGESAVLIAFFVCFVGVLILAYLLGKAIEGLLKMTKMNAFNRVAGALLGLAKALCVLAVVLNFVVIIDHNETLVKPNVKEHSILYKPVYDTGNMLMGSLKQFVEEHKEEIL